MSVRHPPRSPLSPTANLPSLSGGGAGGAKCVIELTVKKTKSGNSSATSTTVVTGTSFLPGGGPTSAATLAANANSTDSASQRQAITVHPFGCGERPTDPRGRP